MKLEGVVLQGERVALRLLWPRDAEDYFRAGFDPMDPEVRRLTGTRAEAGLEDIRAYVARICPDETRYDFLILDRDGRILGESVLNEWDEAHHDDILMALLADEYWKQKEREMK